MCYVVEVELVGLEVIITGISSSLSSSRRAEFLLGREQFLLCGGAAALCLSGALPYRQ